MKKIVVLLFAIVQIHIAMAQNVASRLAAAVQQMEADSQMRHGILSIYVADAQSGKTVYEHNAQIGLAAASTQKLFTSAAAFELLGKDFRYNTRLGYSGNINDGILHGDLYVVGSGDPTLGSWRWKETADSVVLRKMVNAVRKTGIKSIEGTIATNESAFSYQAIPDGWIWEDIGNYYGAGAYQLNWRENQYDLYLRSGNNVGDSVTVALAKPPYAAYGARVNELSTAARGSGDNAYIYLGVATSRNPLLKGTVPAGEKAFSVSGASADPVTELLDVLQHVLGQASIHSRPLAMNRDVNDRNKEALKSIYFFDSIASPPLDSINYWFLRRSINLYGEALVKTMVWEKTGWGSTENGVELVRDFWGEHGIDKAAIHIIDGSGLSPQNRVTTHAEVQVLQFARTRPWFNAFYNALPEYNGMKMKSGSIGGARAFAGYHTAKDGKQYVFSIIVNNYDGSSGEVVKKMYKVLDVLK